MAIETSELATTGSPDLRPGDAPFGPADYADAFTVITAKAGRHSPQDWARFVLEGASRPMRAFLRLGWRYGLGFRPARRNAVLGWPVVAESPTVVVLRHRSWLFAVELRMQATGGQLTWSTRVRYCSPVAGAAWFVVGVLHRRFAPRALHRAVAQAAA